MAVIEVDHVSKEFRLGQLTSIRESALNAFNRLLGRPIRERALFKALDDVSFSVERGEVVGIIGHNGAGKSTLLKLLAGISKPTSGQISVEGRIAPLIEVGTGFIGELTGRENIYLNGSILGLSRREINKKFEEIVDFSELEEFIDTPIKRYSSGMKVKLAFSVATSIDSAILIVDEVLAVGDLAFQRKCFDRMEGLIRHQGKTVLLVSHNIRQVERMCGRVLLLDHGKKIADGEPQKVCNLFYEQSDKKIQNQTVQQNRSLKDRSTITTTGDLELLEVHMLDNSANLVNRVQYRSAITIKLLFKANKIINDPAFGIGAHTPDMIFVANDDSIFTVTDRCIIKPGIFKIEYRIPEMALLPGFYAIRVGVALKSNDRQLFYGDNLYHFQIYSDTLSRSRTVNQGFVSFEGQWIIEDTFEHLE